MSEHFPEQLLHHVTVAALVGMREAVAARSHRTTDRSQFGGMMTQAVTDIVESDSMGQLREKQTHYVAPRRERSRLFVNPMLTS